MSCFDWRARHWPTHMPTRWPMDALDAIASSGSDDDDATDDGGATDARAFSRTTARARPVDREALRRHGLVERTLTTNGARDGASVARAAWGRGDDGSNSRGEGYWGEESAETRAKGGARLTETCARALDAARENEALRARARAESAAEARKRKERYLEAKNALREDDAARRDAERKRRAETGREREGGTRRKPRIDIEATKVTKETSETRVELVENGGFDFGDD